MHFLANLDVKTIISGIVVLGIALLLIKGLCSDDSGKGGSNGSNNSSSSNNSNNTNGRTSN